MVRGVILSWIQNRTKVLRVGLAAVLVIAAAPASAKVLIVRSAGPSAKSYPVGRSLPENARITLRARDTLTLLGSAGTLTLRGPGTFAATVVVRPGPRTVAVDRRPITAAVRGGPLPHPVAVNVPRAFSVWQIDVTHSGSVCLLRSSDVMLWRPDATAPTQLSIVAAGGEVRTIAWPAGRNSIVWVPLSPIINGGAYTLRQVGNAIPTQITVHVVHVKSNLPQAVAAILIKNGCLRQLDALVDDTEDQTPLTAPNVLPTDKLPPRQR